MAKKKTDVDGDDGDDVIDATAPAKPAKAGKDPDPAKPLEAGGTLEVMTPYPEDFPAQSARIIADKLRGRGDHTTACLVHAAWELQGYTQFSTFGNPDHPIAMQSKAAEATADKACTDEEAAAHLDAMRVSAESGAPVTYGAIPPFLIPFILNLVERLLRGK